MYFFKILWIIINITRFNISKYLRLNFYYHYAISILNVFIVIKIVFLKFRLFFFFGVHWLFLVLFYLFLIKTQSELIHCAWILDSSVLQQLDFKPYDSLHQTIVGNSMATDTLFTKLWWGFIDIVQELLYYKLMFFFYICGIPLISINTFLKMFSIQSVIFFNFNLYFNKTFLDFCNLFMIKYFFFAIPTTNSLFYKVFFNENALNASSGINYMYPDQYFYLLCVVKIHFILNFYHYLALTLILVLILFFFYHLYFKNSVRTVKKIIKKKKSTTCIEVDLVSVVFLSKLNKAVYFICLILYTCIGSFMFMYFYSLTWGLSPYVSEIKVAADLYKLFILDYIDQYPAFGGRFATGTNMKLDYAVPFFKLLHSAIDTQLTDDLWMTSIATEADRLFCIKIAILTAANVKPIYDFGMVVSATCLYYISFRFYLLIDSIIKKAILKKKKFINFHIFLLYYIFILILFFTLPIIFWFMFKDGFLFFLVILGMMYYFWHVLSIKFK